MGAAFSDSAGTIAQRGGETLTSAPIPAGVFGDFAEADSFHQVLSQAQATHASNMNAYQAVFAWLAEKTVAAATIFTTEDGQSAGSIQRVDIDIES